MRHLLLCIFLVFSPLIKAQEPKPNWALRYSPLHLAYMDPTIQFQFEKWISPQKSWTASLGLGQESIFRQRDIQGTLQSKLGFKKYLHDFSINKKNNFYLGLEGMYRYSIERQTGFLFLQENDSFDYKLRLNAMAGHFLLGWALVNPNAPSLDFYVGAGIRHVRGRNIGIDPNLPFQRPLTQFNRSSGNSTFFSPLLGICIGIGHWN